MAQPGSRAATRCAGPWKRPAGSRTRARPPARRHAPRRSRRAVQRRPAPRGAAAARAPLHRAGSPRYGNQLMERIAGVTAGVLLGEPEHDVPAAARARVARADRGPVGAPRAAQPALLLDHRGGPGGVRAAASRTCGRSSTRVARSIDEIVREVYGLSARSCARDAGWCGSVSSRPPRCGSTWIAGPTFVEGFAHVLEQDRASGRARARSSSGSRPRRARPGDRARGVLSAPNGAGQLSAQVFEEALTRHADDLRSSPPRAGRAWPLRARATSSSPPPGPPGADRR